ncbi:MAG: hypothetical protein PHS37_03145 [Candidatus Omnitrophica bacterium]|nr:hypothetical protein [Candidatus Omnitrophota bacterium]
MKPGGRIIVTNRLRFLEHALAGYRGALSYRILDEDTNAIAVRKFLQALPDSYEVVSRDCMDEKEFTKKYSKLISGLNRENGSRYWWAMNFTNKNPLLTELCKNIFDAGTITGIMKARHDRTVVIVTSREIIQRFIVRCARKAGIAVTVNLSQSTSLRSLLSRIPGAGICYALVKSYARMRWSKKAFKPVPGPAVDYILMTQFEQGSFTSDGLFSDVYFRGLGKFLKEEKKTFITAGFVAYSFLDIKKHARTMDGVYPLDYFASPGTLFKAFSESLCRYCGRHSIRGDRSMDGEDMSDFIRDEIDKAFDTGQIFFNLSVYHSARAMLSKIRTGHLRYPFENRSWEKMILSAARETSGDIRCVGYQHASLTPKHTNFILEEGEIAHMPFPREIISMGKITRDLMIGTFGFPRDMVKIGCALRQSGNAPAASAGRKMSGELLLYTVLASSLDEYVRVLRFLDQASLPGEYTIRIRPHPAIDFKKALEIYTPREASYTLERGGRLADSLAEADILIYASSTVSIEALALGKPVIHCEFGNFINSDPLFHFSDFKWECVAPKDLSGIINGIRSLGDTDFEERRKSGIRYARDYFYPVNRDNIRVFL